MTDDAAALARMKGYVEKFNRDDRELYPTLIPNSAACQWIAEHAPLLDAPDRDLEETYYFRWWIFRKHITPAGAPGSFVITEFLPPVGWAGKYNTISCAAGHHIREARWLRGEPAVSSYVTYWYNESDNLNAYTNWLDAAVYELCELRGDFSLALNNLDRMVYWYRERERTNYREDVGLFWGSCDRDGAEFAVSGDGFRLPLNCYAAANARAIAAAARLGGDNALAAAFDRKYRGLVTNIEEKLWSEPDRLYLNVTSPDKGRPDYRRTDRRFACRELWGYTPWYFDLAPPGREDAFDLLADPACFAGKYGLTTADRSHPGYGILYTAAAWNAWFESRGERGGRETAHECLWNGPVWPFATSVALTALARSRRRDGLFYTLLKQYAAGHRLNPADPASPRWIDENMNPDTGDWIARTRLRGWSPGGGWDPGKGGEERGKDYNHSTFCDLVIAGLFGVEAPGGRLRARPRIPREWSRAALYHVPCGGRLYTVTCDGAAGTASVEEEGARA